MTGSNEDPLWYKDAVIYQTHIRAFHDSDSDGIGDFRGLTQKLDYLQDLGVTAIWILPFYPSPLRDDGYDTADYTNIHANYGTLRDFRLFMREARRQGLRVITELVLNHTSDQHPWFQRARRAPAGSPERDFYVWSDTPERYQDARIIFQDFEVSNWTWDHEAQAYYWHRFYSHQPDLNFENPVVHRALLEVVDFWFAMGVDGMRLDAVPYLYEQEGTNCENLPQTHAFLKKLRAHVDERFGSRMLLAEANQWPEDAVTYFGDGDECNMAFHFPVMPRMFMAIRMEDRFPIIDILKQTPAIPPNAQWAMFLRNHDELTLEMVTDEERDYMYRAYAEDPQARVNLGIRRRLAPLLQGDRKKIELMNGLLFSLPGTPIVYYGDEIGMGDNIYLGDRNAVRTPMQWSSDRNAGFSRANPQRLFLPVIIDPEYHAEAVNVEAQQNNPHSLLWWTKRLIALRKRYQAFGRGSIEFLYPENRKVLVFLRSHEDEHILVVANLSRFVQYVELDLSAHRGAVPVEVFGHHEFPPVGELPYFLTLGPHAFYWFSLEAPRQEADVPTPRLRTIEVGAWTQLFSKRGRSELEEILPAWIRGRRWFGGKARKIKSVELEEAVPLPARVEGPKGGKPSRSSKPLAMLAFVSVEYTEGDAETYLLPLTVVSGDRAEELSEWYPGSGVAKLRTRDGEQLLVDATWEQPVAEMLFSLIGRRRSLSGEHGKLTTSTTGAFSKLRRRANEELQPSVMGAEQSNTSIAYGDRFILKLFRRPDPGVNPDLEIGRFLTERAAFPHVPKVAGAIEYRRGRSRPRTLAILQEYVPNQGDAWRYTLDELGRFYERALTVPAEERDEVVLPRETGVLRLAGQTPPAEAIEAIGPYLGSARLLGQRTAELHLALCSQAEDAAFAPEAFSTLYQRSLYQSMRALTERTFHLLRQRAKHLPEAAQVLDLEEEITQRFHQLTREKITTDRIRCHGDYHLGQVLYTGKDFVIIDFEGEPARPLSERRIKRSPLRDVAGMLRSFHYAAYTPLVSEDVEGGLLPDDPSVLDPWARLWYLWTSASFLGTYLETAAGSRFIPEDPRHIEVLLETFLIEKAVYEISYEANNRPDWLKIPIQGILQLLEDRS